MQIGDKVVCLNNNDAGSFGLARGEIYTIISGYTNCYYCVEIGGGWRADRFRPLEEMQNTNFIGLAK